MNPLIALLIQAGLQYGPQFVTQLIAILKNPNATIADVENAFKDLKPYSAYGIPDVVPVVPTTGTNPTPSVTVQ